ncbi:MAG: RNA-binding S4 domain-containing protein [Halothiobacillaceae bacterium]
MSHDQSANEGQRLDTWLWAARFFKTRKLAAEAVDGGKVELAGQRAKRARRLRGGEMLTIRKGLEVFEVRVLGLNEQRRPASEARMLYEETGESLARREEQAALRKAAGSIRPPAVRPNSQDRDRLRRMRGKV